jgi:NAD(P)-dependent dehydrogenase (short-subunit alcohol dehydrogenase family)
MRIVLVLVLSHALTQAARRAKPRKVTKGCSRASRQSRPSSQKHDTTICGEQEERMMQSNAKVAVITGASAGLGLEAARELLKRGWRVFGIGRDPARSADAEAELSREALSGALTFLRADLSSLREARSLAAKIAEQTDRLDLLANNAGGMTDALRRTDEGLEQNIAGNHLGPFVLTEALLPLLREGARRDASGVARVVNTSSDGSEMIPGINLDDLQNLAHWSPGLAYCTGKLANVLHARGLAVHHGAEGIVAHAFHPGTVASNFFSHAPAETRSHTDALAKITPAEGADTLIWLATSDEGIATNGGYWYRRAPREPNPVVEDAKVVERFWTASEALVASV